MPDHKRKRRRRAAPADPAERFLRAGCDISDAIERAAMYELLERHDPRVIVDGGRDDHCPGRPRLRRERRKQAS